MSEAIRQSAVYKLPAVAKMFDASSRTIRRWIDAGKFPKPLNLPGPMRFPCAEIDAFLARPKETR